MRFPQPTLRNVYVRSQKAGERVLNGLRKHYDRLHLKVNETKTAIASAFGRKFLGYCLWRSAGDGVKYAVAGTAKAAFKRRIRQITRRTCGRSLNEVAEELRRYVPGWKAYFKLAQTPKIFRQLDEWLRHRLRALQLKHWRRGTTVYRSYGPWVRVRTKRHEWRVMPVAGGATAAWS